METFTVKTITEGPFSIDWSLSRNILLRTKDGFDTNKYGLYWKVIGSLYLLDEKLSIDKAKRLHFESSPFMLENTCDKDIDAFLKNLPRVVKEEDFRPITEFPCLLEIPFIILLKTSTST